MSGPNTETTPTTTPPRRRGLLLALLGGILRGRYRMTMHGPGRDWFSMDVPSLSRLLHFWSHYRRLGYR